MIRRFLILLLAGSMRVVLCQPGSSVVAAFSLQQRQSRRWHNNNKYHSNVCAYGYGGAAAGRWGTILGPMMMCATLPPRKKSEFTQLTEQISALNAQSSQIKDRFTEMKNLINDRSKKTSDLLTETKNQVKELGSKMDHDTDKRLAKMDATTDKLLAKIDSKFDGIKTDLALLPLIIVAMLSIALYLPTLL